MDPRDRLRQYLEQRREMGEQDLVLDGLSVEEVMKLRPRVLRQKYTDPMTAGGEWEYITQVQPGASGDSKGLPIVGVRSASPLNGIHKYRNQELIHNWTFSADSNLLNQVNEETTRLKRGLRGTAGGAAIKSEDR